VLAEAIDSIPEAGTLICHGSHGDPGVEAYLNSFDEYRGRIEFRGNFAFEQMNEVLEGIDVLVAPSLWQENCPLTVKYAIATGTWAVLADQPGMVARREGLERVRFYEPNSVASLKRTLIEVLGETGEQKMGNGSVDFSLAKVIASGALIDVDQQAKELEQIYSKLMK